MSTKTLKLTTVKLVKERSLISGEVIDNPDKAISLVEEYLRDQARELMLAIYFNTAMQPISVVVVSVGSISGTCASPREVYQAAVLCNAKYIILAHNHPSGRVNPSNDDIEITERMVAIGCVMDVPVLDHIIVGSTGDSFSMKKEGSIDFEKRYNLTDCVAE